MAYPPLVTYETEEEYCRHYKKKYCTRGEIIRTFDGFEVYFSKDRFYHSFFERSERRGSKDVFSRQRAERIDWIATALADKSAELYVGWDKKRRRYDWSRRACVVQQDYVVVIRFNQAKTKAVFVTAFVADTPRSLRQIRSSPKWQVK